MAQVLDNLESVRTQIAAAAGRAGRLPEEITLIAVTKTIDHKRIQQVVDQGANHLGENRVQELVDKYNHIQGTVQWHLIGTLQTNKVKNIIDKVAMIHSLDRWALAEEISKRAQGIGRKCPVLVQVNVSGETTKSGFAPQELADFISAAAKLPGIQIQGLMTMAPFVANPEETRPVFRELKRLATEIADLQVPGVAMQHLSMGMSNDYWVAIEEGATLVRVGSRIFGSRVK